MKDYEISKEEVVRPPIYIKIEKTEEETRNTVNELAKRFSHTKGDVELEKENIDPYELERIVDYFDVERCALISPCKFSYVNGRPDVDDKKAIERFEQEILFYPTQRFRLLHDFGGEDIYFIEDISLGEALSLASDFGQNTFIYKDINGLREVCATPFEHCFGPNRKTVLVHGDEEHFDFETVWEYGIGDEVRTEELYGINPVDDLIKEMVKKKKTAEITGEEFGNSYQEKTWYELYLIKDPYPCAKPPAPPQYFYRSMQLIERKVR